MSGDTLQGKDFATISQELKTSISRGKYLEGINLATDFLQGEVGPEQKVSVLLQRGLAERMISQPTRRYTDAIHDFEEVLKIGKEQNNPEWQLEGLRSLIDAHRTSDRDPQFGKENLKDHLKIANDYRVQAEDVMTQIPDWSVAKVNVLIDFGLLARANRENLNEGVLQDELNYYAEAEKGCLELLKQNNPDGPDRYARLKNVRASALAELADPRVLKSTYENEVRVHEQLVQMRHQRGSGDSACVLGLLQEKLENKVEAMRWYKTAVGLASPIGGEVDVDVFKAAYLKLKEFGSLHLDYYDERDPFDLNSANILADKLGLNK